MYCAYSADELEVLPIPRRQPGLVVEARARNVALRLRLHKGGQKLIELLPHTGVDVPVVNRDRSVIPLAPASVIPPG